MLVQLPVIPKPQKTIVYQGWYRLHPQDCLSFPPEGRQAGALLARVTHLGVSVPGAGAVQLALNPAIPGEEGYYLDIDQQGIRITSATPAGLFYGAQTLRQVLPAEIERAGLAQPVDLPYVHIEDQPRFAHRGFMLDVVRHFFGVAEIKRILDLLALQKINRFHWHLSDDQGWRIEIKKYPRLTEIGSKRKQTQVDGWLFSKPVFDGIPHEGFYTQDEVREVVAYARENFIEVIPEIDAPGHATAAIAAYPALQCSGAPAEVQVLARHFSNPMCVGSEFVFEFLDGVFSELAALFPFHRIHIGGDEVNQKPWRRCPACQRRMAQEKLANGHDLQAYFANRLVAMLKARGCQVTGWNELLHDSLDKEVINQFWFPFSRKKSIAEIRRGRPTILSEATSCYLDYSFEALPLANSYACEPQVFGLSETEAASVLGVEAALWTEVVDSRQRLDWQMFPRLLALSEAGWTNRQNREYADFLSRLERFQKRLDELGVQYAAPGCCQPPNQPRTPQLTRLLFTREHPALKEYRKFVK